LAAQSDGRLTRPYRACFIRKKLF